MENLPPFLYQKIKERMWKMKMIKETQEQCKEMELALKAVEQAKARLARAKSKESERLRKEDTHKKIVMGGIVKKNFACKADYSFSSTIQQCHCQS